MAVRKARKRKTKAHKTTKRRVHRKTTTARQRTGGSVRVKGYTRRAPRRRK